MKKFIIIVISLTIISCQDEEQFLQEIPKDQITAENLYQNADGFRNGLNALYSLVSTELGTRTNNLTQQIWTIGVDNGFSAWENSRTRITNNWGGLNNSEVEYFSDLFSWFYQVINSANTIINRAETSNKLSPEQKNEILAEANVFRTWAYRHLTYLWGAVPLSLNEANGSNIRTDWTRESVSEIRDLMITDLRFAEQHLPETINDAGRLVKAVAQHYLAEMYLTDTHDMPDSAEFFAEKVTQGGLYSLITERYGVRANEPGIPYMDMFYDGNTNRHEGNTEALWVFQYEEDNIATGGVDNLMRRHWVNRYDRTSGIDITQEYGGRGMGYHTITKWAFDNFEPQDDRISEHAVRWYLIYTSGENVGDTLHFTLEGDGYRDLTWPYSRKFEWASPDPTRIRNAGQFNDVAYIRMAETLLLQAEAEMKQGKLTEAAESLNKIRRRANASEIEPEDVTLDFILDERSRELMGGEEQRRHTLIRTGKWLERTKLYNTIAEPNVTERDILLPIPQVVIDANLGLQMDQNPDY